MFAVIGEALLDMVQPSAGHTFVAKPGGGPLNIAVGLQRLGHETHFLARFSSGSLGGLVREHAEANGLNLDASVWTDQPTTLAFATLDAAGKASYDFYVDGTADWGWRDADLAALPPRARAAHTGSVAAFLSPGSDTLVRAWERERAAGRLLLSFDPNVRPALVGARESAVALAERFVAASHVVKASDEDLAWLYPEADPAEALRRWASLGPAAAVMTQGPDGCRAVTAAGDDVVVAGVAVDVVDTIGAGDAFESGLLSAIADADALDPGRVRELGPASWEQVLARAVVVSALTCGREGADPPTRAEYDAALRASD